MPASAYVRIYDPSGNLKAVLTADGRDGDNNGFLSLAWKKRVNDIHIAEMVVNAANPDVAQFQANNTFEIWRANPTVGLAPYRSFVGLFRDDILYTDDSNRQRVRARAFGLNSLLSRRIIAYPANTTDKTVFTSKPGETVLKNLVTQNATTAATTANGRDRTAGSLGITVDVDTLAGNTISWNCGGRNNLLTELQKIAAIAGGDFDVVQVSISGYRFRFYPGQLGADRTTGSNAIIFSTDRGNMANPTLSRIRSSEKTVAIIGGRGEDANRAIRVRTGANYATPTNEIEVFVDGRNGNTNAALDAAGDQELADTKYRAALEYDVLQTPLYYAEQAYFLGDKVLATYQGVSLTQQVYEIAFEYNGAEAVSIVMRDL